jgi:hypothetical protein
MITGHFIAALMPIAARTARRWLFRAGGIGLIPLGLLDNSLIPMPGILDVAAIVLSSRQEQLWLYYGLIATAVIKVCDIFERWGFAAIAIPALLPPPVPMVPFLLAAGAMQYPARKFVAALTLGRLSRYLILSYLAARYGRQIIAFIAGHGHPVAVSVILAVMSASTAVFYFWRGSTSKKRTWTIGERFF